MDNNFIVLNLNWANVSLKNKVIGVITELFKFNVPMSQPKYAGMMSTLEKRMNMSLLIEQVLAYKIEGEVVEVGCNDGKSACILATYLQFFDPNNHIELHLFDSFEGLPEPTWEDGLIQKYKVGEMSVKMSDLYANFHLLKLPIPFIHPGWFQNTLEENLPLKIRFAHLDSDFYESILVSLQHVYPKLTKGAICLIDDYDDFNLPGVKQACDEFFLDKPESVSSLYAGHYFHGYFRKI